GLKLQNKAELDAYIAKRGFKPLTGAQFVARYSPSVAQAQAVANYLKQQGFTDVKISSNRILVSGNAPAADVKRAFSVNLVSVKTHDGRVAYANTNNATVPASMQSYINGVMGLQTVHIPHLFYREYTGGSTNAVTGHQPTDFPSIYGADTLPVASDINIGILAEGNLSKTITSLNTFTSANGFPTVTTRTVGTPTSDTSGTLEWELDSQTIVGAAGGQVGSITFYMMPNAVQTSDITEGVNQAVMDNGAKIINGSLGISEIDAQNDGTYASTDALFQQGAAQGQSFSFSTGDDGASDCYSNEGTTAACWPATSAYVVATGGTTLDASTGSGATWNNETVWSGAGGAQSAITPKPSWQTLWSGANRVAPDIAFDADPNSGAKIYNGSRQTQVGGTSLSSPMFVGFWARVMEGKGNLGFPAPLLYPLSASDFHDITSGSNGNSAGPGFDVASGRGSVIWSAAYSQLSGGGGNQPPVASFTYKTKSLYVQVTSTSTDPDGTIASVKWDSGDGRTSTKTPLTYKYAKPGTYTVTLTVTDNDGATNSTSQQVTVQRGG
ncbi:MAG TPA: PKD domain-containing protein, partial [Rhodanobacteraceae bacterium]|nr:PKD domain-containing protein [Rhodanobacteraceae bacterium]